MNTTINHIAFIMDGNRRWATEQGMNKSDGHRHGQDNMYTVLDHCKKLGIQEVSIYAFSTENWNRSTLEVKALMQLFRSFLIHDRDKILEREMRVRFIGDLNRFDQDLQDLMKELEEVTRHHDRLLSVCVSYGGRLEIVHAAQSLAHSGDEYNEENFEKHLWSHDMGDVDLMIRTGGNQRLSNFLLWRCAYAELYFTETKWPGFSTDELDQIIETYENKIQINKGK